jgi:hypothetical protein
MLTKDHSDLYIICKANATMFVVKYHSMSILHAQLAWHRGNIHCSYFLVFVEITVGDLKWIAISTKSLEQLNITGKVKECKNTEYSDYNLYSCRLTEEESKNLLILHAQLDWHRGNIHCSYFLVFVEITVEDLKGGRKSCITQVVINKHGAT